MTHPWATDPPRITAHQVSRIVELIADYTTAEATDLIHTLSARNATAVSGWCSSCGRIGNAHSRTCPTRGDNS